MRRQKTVRGRQKASHGHKHPRFTALVFILSSVFCLLSPSILRAAPSQDDVFKSIEENVNEKSDFDSRPVILLACAGGAIVLLLAVVNRRSKRAVVSKALNNPGRLMREVLKEVPLKSAELRQLKTIAASVETEAGEQPSPLALLLCPSLLAKGLKAAPNRVDPRTVAQVVRKMHPHDKPSPG